MLGLSPAGLFFEGNCMHGSCISRTLLEHFREETNLDAGTDKGWKMRLKERRTEYNIGNDRGGSY
jgi:hypothetical protein